MANDAHEEFWGCTLAKAKKEYTWNPTETEDDVEHKLQVTSACLGPKAKDGERNLIELTTEDDDGRKITCAMVSLRAGGKECLHLELGFNNPTKFTLKEGNGPISLCGVHLQAVPIDFDEEDSESEDDEDIPNLVEPKEKKVTEKKSPVKRALEESKKQDKPAAKKKKVIPESEDDEEDEEEEEDEEDEGEEDSEDEEMPSLLDGEAEEDDEEESEDEDEPEGDDVDSEEEDDEDEESEEEETPVKKSNKKLTNGHTPKVNGKPEKAGKKAVPTTPKSAGPKKTPEEIKAMLVKSPNLPKKFDKFANYMKNNMKITDGKSQKEFWEYIQKNKK